MRRILGLNAKNEAAANKLVDLGDQVEVQILTEDGDLFGLYKGEKAILVRHVRCPDRMRWVMLGYKDPDFSLTV